VQIRIRRIDEDRDRREIGDARRSARLRGAQHGFLRDAIRLRVEAQRRFQLGEPIGDAVLALEHLRQ
jgi:hypothetical protein